MRKSIYVVMMLIIIIFMILGCSSGNLVDVKVKAPEVWKQNGFEVVAYEGFTWGFGGLGTKYGGAHVWHRLKKIPDNGITYSGFIIRWGDEYHVYGPLAIDAIKP